MGPTFNPQTDYPDEELQRTCDAIGAPITFRGRTFYPSEPWKPGLGGGAADAPNYGGTPVGSATTFGG